MRHVLDARAEVRQPGPLHRVRAEEARPLRALHHLRPSAEARPLHDLRSRAEGLTMHDLFGSVREASGVRSGAVQG